MTAETLKPFITPTSAGHYPAAHPPKRRQCSSISSSSGAIAIGLSSVGIILATVLLGLTIWHSGKISALEAEVKTLNHLVEKMRDRLGLNYLEDLEEFKKEYSNVLIDIPNNSTDSDDDDDTADDGIDDINDDEDDDDFYPGEYTDLFDNDDDLDAMVKKYNSYDSIDPDDEDEDDEDSIDSVDLNVSDDDNLYDDYGKFKDSKKKQSSRKTRAIANALNGLPLHEDSYLTQLNKSSDGLANKVSHVLNQNSREHNQGQSQQLHHRYKKPSMRYDWSDWSARLPHHSSLEDGATQSNKASSPHQLSPVVGGDRLEERRRISALHQRKQRRRKIPITKSGESLLSGKSTDRSQPAYSVLPAAHFHLNNKIPDRHAAIKVDSYSGDLYLGTPSGPSHPFGLERFFKVENGVLTVREAGLYYIYAQVCYNNTHDQNGFVIFHGHKPFLQCLNTVPTNLPLKIHTCHTSGLIHLRANETIHLRDFHSDRNVILKDSNNRSYFGLIKI